MSRLKNFIQSQLPDHIVDNYPQFVSFVEAYYEWLGTDQAEKFFSEYRQNQNIDTSIDLFFEQFLKEVAVNVPKKTFYDKKKLIKRVEEVYRAKGTPKAFDLLFKMVFGSGVDILEPKTRMLRASDGRWVKEKSLRVKVTQGDGFNFDGALIVGKSSGAKALVDRTKFFMYNQFDVYEYFISTNSLSGDFELAEEVEFISGTSTIGTGKLYVIPVRVVLDTPIMPSSMVKAVINERVPLRDTGLALLNDFNNDGLFGADYQSDIQEDGIEFIQEINETRIASSSFSVARDIEVIDGLGQRFYIDDKVGNGAYCSVVALDPNTRVVKKIAVTEFGAGYDPKPHKQTLRSVVGYDIDVTIEKGVLCEYEGYWKTDDSLLDSSNVLQDSFYFQDFSYVVRSSIPINEWKEMVKNLLHPAGMEFFSEYRLDIKAELGVNYVLTTLKRIIKILLRDLTPSVAKITYKINTNIFIFGLGPTYDTMDKIKWEFYPNEAGTKMTFNKFSDADNNLANTMLKDIGDLVMGNFIRERAAFLYGNGKYSYFAYGGINAQNTLPPITNYKQYLNRYSIKKKQRTVLDSYIRNRATQ